MRQSALRIGEAAAQAGVPTATLRFYERRGLLPAPVRGASGYRAYSEDAVVTVRFIKRAQELGFTLAEVAELLNLREAGRGCAEAKQVAQATLDKVDERIRRLIQMRKTLSELLTSCSGEASQPCPFLESFEEEAAHARPAAQRS